MDVVTNHTLDITKFPTDPYEKPWLVTGDLITTVPWNKQCIVDVFTAECQNCVLLSQIEEIFQKKEMRIETIKMEPTLNSTIIIYFDLSFIDSERSLHKIQIMLNNLLDNYDGSFIAPGQSCKYWNFKDGMMIIVPDQIRYRISSSIDILYSLEENQEIANCIDSNSECALLNEELKQILEPFNCAFMVALNYTVNKSLIIIF